MKTISLDDFTALIDTGKWTHSQEIELIDQSEPRVEIDEECNQTTVYYTSGYARVLSSCDGISITYTEPFEYDDFQPDSFSAGSNNSHVSDVWMIEGVSVIDDDGEIMPFYELLDYINMMNTKDGFTDVDYSGLVINKTTDVDGLENALGGFEIITLKIDNAPDLRFTGRLIASASSGRDNRWTELYLYQTKVGSYVCQSVGRTQFADERDRFSGDFYATLGSVIKFFGYGWLAKKIYDDAGIDTAKVIK